jgi:hypothetical protein
MTSAQLDLFSHPSFQNELFGFEYNTIRPLDKIDDEGPIHFLIKNNKEYINLAETVLHLKVKVTNADGSVIATAQDKDDVALINNSMHSIFSDVTISLNGKKVDGGDGYYPFRAYMQSLLGYSEKVQNEQMFAIGFIKDDHKEMSSKTNAAYIKRKAWTAVGAIKEFYGKLKCPFLEQVRFLPPGIELSIKLHRAKDAFALFSTVAGLKPKIKIEKIALNMLTAKVNPNIMQYHMNQLALNIPAVYEIHPLDIQIIPLAMNDLGGVKDNLFFGRVPKYLIMVMVPTTAFYGDYSSNPFNFKHYTIKHLQLTRDGEPVPFEPFQPNFTTGNCLREYMSLYQSNNLLGKNTVLPISFEEFKSGYTNFQWNLSDDGCGVNASPNQTADIKLTYEFETKLPEAVSMIVFGHMEKLVMVSGTDEVSVDDF